MRLERMREARLDRAAGPDLLPRPIHEAPPASGTLEITAGQVLDNVRVQVIGDLTAEATEQFSVVLSSPTRALLVDPSGVVTITDNDPLFAVPYTSFETGSYPNSVAIGDLNGDGKPDLTVTNWNSKTVSVLLNVGAAIIGADVDPAAPAPPRTFQLLASRPNPSRGSSEIRFLLPSACTVDVNLFDLAGRKVRSLASGELSTPGEHSIRWDGRDASGTPVRDGVYFVQVRAGRDAGVRRLIVLR
jgi:hypothetical protein